MAFATGLSFPSGDASGRAGDSLSRRYAWQWPVMLDIGAKITESIFVGGYLTMAFGGEGSDNTIEEYCDDDDADFENDVSCSVVAFRLGIEGQYHFIPDGTWNPWVGYGFGYEWIHQSLTDIPRGYSESVSTWGLTAAKVDLGIDYRAKVGIGPFVQFSVGRFTGTRTEINNAEQFDGGIDDQAFHLWTTVGARLVLLP